MCSRWTTNLLIAAVVFSDAAAQQPPKLVPNPSHAIRDTRGGGGAAFEISSAILKQTRHISVALPASFAQSPAGRRYPVTVVFDGEGYLAPAAAVADELTRNGQIPESIIVAIENEDPFQGRVHDLTPPGLSVSGSGLNEGGDQFLDFIEKELLPAVDKQFRGGPPRAMIGHSSGAILAIWAAATRPNFRAVVAIDAPVTLSDNWLAKRLTARATSDTTPLRFSYYSARFPWPDSEWAALSTTAPKTWKIHREKLEREGHETAFMIGAYLGLREVYGDYSRFAAPEVPTTSILPYYTSVSATFGAPVIPPQRIVRDVLDDLVMEGRGPEARNAYRLLASSYGAPNDSATLLTDIARIEREPPPKETVESLMATPAPTPEEARAFIGEWVGDAWQSQNAPRSGKTVLRIKVVDGKVVAEREDPNAPPAFRVRQFTYLKVTPQGLTFGMMNGMRPRGFWLSEGILKGDTLSGKQRWGGINFKDPSGVPADEAGFRFVRRK